MTCDWCDLPIAKDQQRIAYEGCVYHLPCAHDAESGKLPPVLAQQNGGLWGFTTPPQTLDSLSGWLDPQQSARSMVDHLKDDDA